jgi:hypothetical protein
MAYHSIPKPPESYRNTTIAEDTLPGLGRYMTLNLTVYKANML